MGCLVTAVVSLFGYSFYWMQIGELMECAKVLGPRYDSTLHCMTNDRRALAKAEQQLRSLYGHDHARLTHSGPECRYLSQLFGA